VWVRVWFLRQKIFRVKSFLLNWCLGRRPDHWKQVRASNLSLCVVCIECMMVKIQDPVSQDCNCNRFNCAFYIFFNTVVSAAETCQRIASEKVSFLTTRANKWDRDKLVLKTTFTFYFSFRNSRQWVFTFFSRMHDGLTHTRVRHMYVPTPTRSAREVHVGRWSLKSWVKLVLCFCLWRAQLKLAIQKLEIYSILVLSNCHSGMPRVKCYQQHSQLMCFTWTNS
jgi:hypothetical protein